MFKKKKTDTLHFFGKKRLEQIKRTKT